MVYLTPFPPVLDYIPILPDPVPLKNVSLLEMNRGKTGALNFFNDYLRAKVIEWSYEKVSNQPIQTFCGIVDARHAVVEPNIFWNDALPYFSIVKGTYVSSRKFGFGTMREYPTCITVQYPQFFSNVGADDYLDNSNSTYYNLWQTLRDCGKCVTSSGTNTIW